MRTSGWAMGIAASGLVASLVVGCGRGQAAALLDVTGRVIDDQGFGHPGFFLSIPGHATVETDSDGVFHVPNVVAPYSAVLQGSDAREPVRVYLSLRSANPTFGLGNQSAIRAEGWITGTVPVGDVATELLVMASTNRPHRTNSSDSGIDARTGTYTRGVTWSGSNATFVTVRALRHTTDPEGAPSVFTGYGMASGLLIDGLTQTWHPLALAPVPTGVIEGTVSNPRDTVISSLEVDLRWADHDVHDLARLRPAGDFAVAVPVLPGLAVDLTAIAHNVGGATYLRRVDVAPGTVALEMDVPAAAGTVLPAEGDQFDQTTLLVADAFPGRVYGFWLAPTDFSNPYPPWPTGPTYYIHSDHHQVSIPDLRFLGIELPPDTPYGYTVTTWGPYDSLDAAVGAQGIHSLAHDGQFETICEAIQVFTAP